MRKAIPRFLMSENSPVGVIANIRKETRQKRLISILVLIMYNIGKMRVIAFINIAGKVDLLAG